MVSITFFHPVVADVECALGASRFIYALLKLGGSEDTGKIKLFRYLYRGERRPVVSLLMSRCWEVLYDTG